MTDEQQTPDDRLLAALKALTNRGHEGLEALLADVLEGRARTDHQLLGDAADRPALLNLARSRGWTTSPRQRFDKPGFGAPAGPGPALGAPAEEWARHLGFSADDTAGGDQPFDQENQ